MIQISNLSKSYPSVQVLDQLSFSLESGRTAFIQGPSGCGKTTLLRLIAGLEIPEQGEISLGGRTVSTPADLTPPYQRNLGFLFQTNALWPHLTVSQNIAFGLRGDQNLDIDPVVAEILVQMDLSALRNRYPNQLSGGQLRRTALARTIVTRPDYLLLDEPLTNLDEDLQGSLVDYLLRLVQAEGITALIVTHNKDLISSLDGDKYTLERGKLYAD